MTTLKKTTLTIPEEVLRAAKLLAVQKNKPLNKIVSEALRQKLNAKTRKTHLRPQSILGKFKIGVGKIYKSRSEIYG